jgi:hypothetical protein
LDDIIGRNSRNNILGPSRQCTATNRMNARCQRAPIVGGFVCSLHGGKAEHVKRAARERLLALVDPAVDSLLRALRSGDPCDRCGRSDSDKDPVVLRAAQIVLDRCGFGPSATVAIGPAPELTSPWVRYLSDTQLLQVQLWIDEAKARMAAAEEEPAQQATHGA